MGWAQLLAMVYGQNMQGENKALGGLMMPRKTQNQDFSAQQVLNQFIADRGGNPYGG